MPPGRGEIIEGRGLEWMSGQLGGEDDEQMGDHAKEVDWNLRRDGGGENIGRSLSTGMQKDGLRRRNRLLVARQDDGNASIPVSISGTQTFDVVIETSFITVSADMAIVTPVGFAASSQQYLPSIPTPPASPSDAVSAPIFSPSPSASATSAGTPKTTALAVATSNTVTPTPFAEFAAALSTSESASTTITNYLTPSSSSSTGRPRNSTITSTTSSTTTQWIFSTTTVSGTVVVYASPVPDANSDAKISPATQSTTITEMGTRISMSTGTPGASENGWVQGGVGGVGGITNTVSGSPSPSGSSVSGSGGGSSSSSSLTPKLVGGLIGGLAATAMVLWMILFLIRRHKRNAAIQERVDAGYGGPAAAMTQRSSSTPITAAASFLGSFGRNSRQSAASEPVSEERGFYKVSGRKLPPAIGGPRPVVTQPHGSSIFQEDDGRWPGTPPVSSPLSSRPSRFSAATQDTASPTSTGFGASVVPMGAALGTLHTVGPSSETSPVNPFDENQYPPYPPYGRVPGSSTPGPSTPTLTSRIPEENAEIHFQAELDRERANTPRLSAQHSRDFAARSSSRATDRDGVGRSLPSHDGSRTSRFTEDIV